MSLHWFSHIMYIKTSSATQHIIVLLGHIFTSRILWSMLILIGGEGILRCRLLNKKLLEYCQLALVRKCFHKCFKDVVLLTNHTPTVSLNCIKLQ